MRRCGCCATCKHRCGDCQTCLGDVSKSKAGCKKRFECLKNSSFVDEPSLMRGCVKRLREEDEEKVHIHSKDLKLSESCEEEDSKNGTGQIMNRILQFESVS